MTLEFSEIDSWRFSERCHLSDRKKIPLTLGDPSFKALPLDFAKSDFRMQMSRKSPN